MNNENSEPYLIFDFESERKIFSHPIKVIVANTTDEVADALDKVERASDQGYFAAGYLSYEAGYAFIDSLQDRGHRNMPLLWFGIFTSPQTYTQMPGNSEFKLSEFYPNEEPQRYIANIQRIKGAIASGDTYQVNYTMKLVADFQGDDLALYKHLENTLESNYCAYLNLGRFRILSASPELFFSKNRNTITTRPMKGTVRRGRWSDEDEGLRQWLHGSKKNHAENIMIVDLLRNDLGRIAEVGTVHVSKLLEIEKYPYVYQMTSTVSAQIPNGTSLTKIFEALYPCGSVTGAPKISTMSIINELETSPRGIYCGAIGFISPNQNAIFNVAIRTLVIDSQTGKAEFGTGGGITWDSLSDDEYQEALTKADMFGTEVSDFQLLETLLLEHGEYFLLERHLERIQSSAHYFDIPFDLDAITLDMEKLASENRQSILRVRLLVSSDGKHSIEFSNHMESIQNRQVVLSSMPVNSSDKLLYHKTTQRTIYNQRKQNYPNAFDVLLSNEKGEITEFTNGNIVAEKSGHLVTPPLTCGLLPGTYRAELLANGVIMEKVIKKEDLGKMDKIWFINSVRKWIEVSLG